MAIAIAETARIATTKTHRRLAGYFATMAAGPAMLRRHQSIRMIRVDDK